MSPRKLCSFFGNALRSPSDQPQEPAGAYRRRKVAILASEGVRRTGETAANPWQTPAKPGQANPGDSEFEPALPGACDMRDTRNPRAHRKGPPRALGVGGC